jgi:hypothetical protein
VARQSEATLDLLLSVMHSDLYSISLRLMAQIRPGGAERIAEYVLSRLGG